VLNFCPCVTKAAGSTALTFVPCYFFSFFSVPFESFFKFFLVTFPAAASVSARTCERVVVAVAPRTIAKVRAVFDQRAATANTANGAAFAGHAALAASIAHQHGARRSGPDGRRLSQRSDLVVPRRQDPARQHQKDSH
jgi:hypothetical protein